VDVILLDINLPGLNGLDGIVFLKRKWPLVPVIVLSAQDGPDTVRVAHERGAVCFISKADTADNIVSLLFQVLQGEYPAPETELGEIADVPLIIPLRLTPRQCEVLELLHQGKPNKLIARQLSLSENTVRNHVQAIFNFLQVASRSEAIFEARRRGLIG
jgi:DNA-binding NarL/FixJ family response regulator